MSLRLRYRRSDPPENNTRVGGAFPYYAALRHSPVHFAVPPPPGADGGINFRKKDLQKSV